MKKMAEGNNPHVVNMLGAVTIQEPLCVITEFVEYGDLLKYLQASRIQLGFGAYMGGPNVCSYVSVLKKKVKLPPLYQYIPAKTI